MFLDQSLKLAQLDSVWEVMLEPEVTQETNIRAPSGRGGRRVGGLRVLFSLRTWQSSPYRDPSPPTALCPQMLQFFVTLLCTFSWHL